jgi:small-conductance mechanosensitive channel
MFSSSVDQPLGLLPQVQHLLITWLWLVVVVVVVRILETTLEAVVVEQADLELGQV